MTVHGRPVRAAACAALALLTIGAPVGGGAVASGRPAADQPPTVPLRPPSFRAGVDVVSLNVTVTNGAGHYVSDLGAGDFSVFEDGVGQDVAFFSRTNLPIALCLLLDSSASMEEKLATAQEAAVGFARRLRREDLGELIDFDREVKVLQGFTSDSAALERAIRSTTPGGSTAMYTALYISLKELRKLKPTSEEEIRRQAIVVLSDGEDTSSLVTFDQVLDQAKRSETAIYAIGLRSKDELVTKGYKEADFVLRDLAQQTGGRAFFPTRVEDLAGIYTQIADELANQYLVGYLPKNARQDGAWRRVAVRVGREGLTARTKQGYFAPTR
jgi:Ca-activated chloride channel homolog